MSLRLRFEGTVMRTTRGEDKDGMGKDDGMNGERKKRDLVEELVGEESDDHHTHRADGSHEILNDIVVDRGPNASTSDPPHTCFHSTLLLTLRLLSNP